MDLYLYPYPSGICYPVDTRYPPTHCSFSIQYQTPILSYFLKISFLQHEMIISAPNNMSGMKIEKYEFEIMY
jgi:hypothetical protein